MGNHLFENLLSLYFSLFFFNNIALKSNIHKLLCDEIDSQFREMVVILSNQLFITICYYII